MSKNIARNIIESAVEKARERAEYLNEVAYASKKAAMLAATSDGAFRSEIEEAIDKYASDMFHAQMAWEEVALLEGELK